MSLPRWEQAMVLLPFALWAGNFICYFWRPAYVSMRGLLFDLAGSFCAMVDFNALCAIGGDQYVWHQRFYSLQLVSIHFLTIGVSLILISLQIVRLVFRIANPKARLIWRDWIWAAVIILGFHSGLFLYLDYFSSLKGSLAAAFMASTTLFYIRLLLSLLRRTAQPEAVDVTAVVRRRR